ncbi:hypothetical protein CHGG_03751 [Chaetomium globosum CBS 148.51]|uniref:Uncharacterized protein n=1 Tax=Chaetomium globosum (strain ATCC 6205 / CBS 148.51 / DSM 1962 / NBRC 6347 / NRRL 1970) TaxID=306901 RepID=Q2H395_CHAGB|nr:uncharacterized protein CHGG_03751 [Chaetomium globosum CBS 148.51]EAQ87132.1 hypothetical protein CHGG_03751 [Chaetomium globosum CBS 148.51]
MTESEMAQEAEVDDEFSRLWQRHLTALRDDFSATSVQALPSLPSESRSFDGKAAPNQDLAHPWDAKIESVVDVLDELTLPETPWFPDRDGYTDTAFSSPLNSSCPRTIGSPKGLGLPDFRVEDYSETALPDLKGKGVSIAQTWSQRKPPPPWHEDATVPFLLHKQLLDGQQPLLQPSVATTATTATTTTHTPTASHHEPRPPAIATQVHALILTWATPTPIPATPSHHHTHTHIHQDDRKNNNSTDTLRATLKRRGYRVQCRTIPTDYPTAAVETMLDRFLERSAADTLLVVYYRGWGCLGRDGRMVFVRCPGDVLLVFDCTALPGARAEQLEMRVEAGMVSSPSTKQLLGGPEWDGGRTGFVSPQVVFAYEGRFAGHPTRVGGVCQPTGGWAIAGYLSTEACNLTENDEAKHDLVVAQYSELISDQPLRITGFQSLDHVVNGFMGTTGTASALEQVARGLMIL